MAVQLVETRYGFIRDVSLSFEVALARMRAALQDEGFGILTEIDVSRTLKEKLGVTHPREVILGACNPHLAHRALTAEPGLGLLLPCNVTVRDVGGRCQLGAVDAMRMMALVGNDALRPIAEEANRRLRNAIEKVA